MALPQPHDLSEDEYLAFEREQEGKHEFLDGRIYAMSGASADHNRIVGSTYATLYSQIVNRSCDVFPSDMRVRVPSKGLFTYPDISVVCGEAKFDDTSQPDTLLNPQVIIEVLSPSTEAYDRGDKFENYRALSSLQTYLLISQDKPRIERFNRQDDGLWTYTYAMGLEAVLELPAIQCELALQDVYAKVTFTDNV